MTEKVCWEICKECNGKRETCCTLGVPVTIEDIKVIESQGYKLDDFAVAGEWDEDEIDGNEEWWKKNLITVDGKHFKIHLREKENSHCFFLKDKEGCTLGDKRPALCKLYPFWVDDEKNEIEYDDPEEKFCHFHGKDIPLEEGMKLFGETEESIRSHFSKIKEDCDNNHEKHKEIILRLIKEDKIQ
ncbi:MAG: YkgJ family cysteine cluster protein [Nanoarchaeota archaeon]|nr:YkgJ family cysteine cluster protein [Nanoarchaeota archaeon]